MVKPRVSSNRRVDDGRLHESGRLVGSGPGAKWADGEHGPIQASTVPHEQSPRSTEMFQLPGRWAGGWPVASCTTRPQSICDFTVQVGSVAEQNEMPTFPRRRTYAEPHCLLDAPDQAIRGRLSDITSTGRRRHQLAPLHTSLSVAMVSRGVCSASSPPD